MPMELIAALAGSLLNSESKSGQTQSANSANISNGGAISNAGNAGLQNSNVQPVGGQAQFTSPSSGGQLDWEGIAKVTNQLL